MANPLTISPGEVEALKTVRNMAYDFDDDGNILCDLINETGSSGDARDLQVAAIDTVDALLFRIQGLTQASLPKQEELTMESEESDEEIAAMLMSLLGAARDAMESLPDEKRATLVAACEPFLAAARDEKDKDPLARAILAIWGE